MEAKVQLWLLILLLLLGDNSLSESCFHTTQCVAAIAKIYAFLVVSKNNHY